MSDWSNLEVELVVSDYFEMLLKELSGITFNKAEHRRRLIPLLSNRSSGSVEFKHQNISAVLIKLGQPYINGYKPLFNYQGILEDVVKDYLNNHLDLEKQFQRFADSEIIETAKLDDFNTFIVSPPAESNLVKEPGVAYLSSPVKTNFLDLEQRNRKLGLLGEEIVMQFERLSLINLGKQNLADQIRWISKEEGDGAGFDILSRNMDGTDKYIEVKTTKLGKDTPIFFSRNELLFSHHKSTAFHLYRLFNFEKRPQMFVKNGPLDAICTSVPISYKGFF